MKKLFQTKGINSIIWKGPMKINRMQIVITIITILVVRKNMKVKRAIMEVAIILNLYPGKLTTKNFSLEKRDRTRSLRDSQLMQPKIFQLLLHAQLLKIMIKLKIQRQVLLIRLSPHKLAQPLLLSNSTKNHPFAQIKFLDTI